MSKLSNFVCCESIYGGGYYPSSRNVFGAFRRTSLTDIKVVIIGQDPYFDGKATGLAFAVSAGTPVRDSLRIIFNAVTKDCGQPPRATGDLTRWAKQGVLLLNTVLTVARGQAGSHRGLGWETFTSKAVDLIDAKCDGVVFLWGDDAARTAERVDPGRHCVLPPAAHPMARGRTRSPRLIDSAHFSQANRWLKGRGEASIHW